MDKSSLELPVGNIQNILLIPDAKLELLAMQGGHSKLDMISGNLVVVAFTIPGLADSIVTPERLRAANEPTSNLVANLQYQWWDDNMLAEPLEPLRDFE